MGIGFLDILRARLAPGTAPSAARRQLLLVGAATLAAALALAVALAFWSQVAPTRPPETGTVVIECSACHGEFVVNKKDLPADALKQGEAARFDCPRCHRGTARLGTH
jgi:hypothetical protein